MSKKDFKAKIAKKKARDKRVKKTEKKASAWQKFTKKQGLSAIVAALAVVLVAAIIVAITMNVEKKKEEENKGPGIKISENFTHTAPKGLDEKDIVEYINNDAKKYLADGTGYSLQTAPRAWDNGWLVYDSDGIARRYRDDAGVIHALPQKDWDENVLEAAPFPVLSGVKCHVLVYKDANGTKPEACYIYFVLDDKLDMACLYEVLESKGFDTVLQSSETVAEIRWNSDDMKNVLESNNMDYTLENFARYLEVVLGATKK